MITEKLIPTTYYGGGKSGSRGLNLASLERGLHHVRFKAYVEMAGGGHWFPQLHVLLTDGSGGVRPELLASMEEYFKDHLAMSYTWKSNTARAVGLLIDYGVSMAASSEYEKWLSEGILEQKLFRGFALALANGTATKDSSGRVADASGLHWKPLGIKQAGVLLSAATRYLKWLGQEVPDSAWAAAADTDRIADHPLVALKLAVELYKRQSQSFLGHLKGVKREPAHPYPFIVKQARPPEGALPTFPARYVLPFLCEGFVEVNGRLNDEAEIVAHLIFGLGIRMSEAFHLFHTDIQFVEDVPWVFFHHPEHGKVICGNRETTRREYLEMFGMLPRNRDGGRAHAGWKGMKGDGEGTPGYWLPVDLIRGHAAQILKRYLFVTRPAIMAARPRSAGDHPFLLVNPRHIEAANTGVVGDPYSMEAFKGAWMRAVHRFGTHVNDPAMARIHKFAGNTPHGGRHFYGKFLYSLGVDGPLIQECMHHRSLEAHLTYARLTPAEINQVLQAATDQSATREPFTELRSNFMSQFQTHPASI